MKSTGVLSEGRPGESRVAMKPDFATRRIKLGHSCVIEAGAGDGAKTGLSGAAYAEARGEVLPDANAVIAAADMWIRACGLAAADVSGAGGIAGLFWPVRNRDLLKHAADVGAAVVASACFQGSGTRRYRTRCRPWRTARTVAR